MKKIFKLLGFALSLVSFYFIIRIFINFDIDFSVFLNLKIILAILILAFIFSINVFLNGFAWSRTINLFSNQKTSLKNVFRVYASANIGKYLPGNVGHYAGRNIIGQEYELSQRDMLFSSILEVFLKLAASFLMIISIIGNDIQHFFSQIKTNFEINYHFFLNVSYVTVVLFVLLILFYLSPLIEKLFKIKKIQFIKKIKILLMNTSIYIFVFLLNAFIFIIILSIIDPLVFSKNNAFYLSAIYILTWLVGYLTPGAPGGIGVKEGLLILFLSSSVGVETITIVSIVIRIISIFSDLIAFFIGKFFKEQDSEIIN